MSAVLSLVPATRTVVNALKTPLSTAVKSMNTNTVTVALRDNGAKVNGTLVFVEGNHGQPGDVFNARNSRNNSMYGPHTVLGTVEFTRTEGDELVISNVDSLIDVTADTSAPMFWLA